ncbi:hypothetical protein SAMD00019534_032500 [Acytostelium subglobosum LB1]|uniref:hypothetical protein n=1 Tax=Acytostelium subglobosum LB1 TaxID=1410327 RepID=UPI0006447E98|nr:hypothetical protein SAMD00019534_032500 [Acytostelium subglobosum LB1]GAM20075.1 hypothetical protein SAMD00019534_032500 [Acytostelium subglobosum LB1]|eukprot:XP_012756837.1 hypothetical protein SAMD00019534_032500 [Acytostelium subglobosum LB1]
MPGFTACGRVGMLWCDLRWFLGVFRENPIGSFDDDEDEEVGLGFLVGQAILALQTPLNATCIAK